MRFTAYGWKWRCLLLLASCAFVVPVKNVGLPFTFNLNWNPSFSYATVPKGMQNIPRHWVVLSTPVLPAERGLREFRNITIEVVEITGARQVFSATGLPENVIRNVKWKNVTAEGQSAGVIEYASEWTMSNVKLQTRDGAPVKASHNNNVDTPQVVKQ